MALSATYSSAHQFLVSGDQTNVFVGGRSFRADCGIDGIKIGMIGKSSYSAPDTTVDVVQYDSDDLTANLTTVEISSLKPGTTGVGNLPFEINVMARGLRRFFLPTFNATGTLGITPGYLHIFDGSREKVLTVESALTKAISALSNDTWYFIYVTAPANHSILVTATNISVSTTAPTYNETYRGWYDASYNRCIGFFKSNGSGTMRFFKTDGVYYRFNVGTNRITCNMAGAWTTVTLDLPIFSFVLLGEVTMIMTAEYDGAADLYIRDLDTSQAAIGCLRISKDGPGGTTQQKYTGYSGIHTIGTDKKINVYSSVTLSTYWSCNGVFLPRGMQCT